MVENGSLNRLLPLVNFINCDPLSDHSKSKAQTTKVQQLCHTLPMPFAEINYLAKQKQNISFSSLPDGKSASRKNILLDTPCAAGARSTSFHPAATTGRQLTGSAHVRPQIPRIIDFPLKKK